MSVLKATNRGSESSLEDDLAGITTVKVEDGGVGLSTKGSTNRTAPIVGHRRTQHYRANHCRTCVRPPWAISMVKQKRRLHPVILLTKLPEVAFSVVIPSLLTIVGLETVSQTTPDAVIAAPPLVSIVPPLTAELSVIE